MERAGRWCFDRAHRYTLDQRAIQTILDMLVRHTFAGGCNTFAGRTYIWSPAVSAGQHQLCVADLPGSRRSPRAAYAALPNSTPANRQVFIAYRYHPLHTHQRNRSMPITKRRAIVALAGLFATLATVFV